MFVGKGELFFTAVPNPKKLHLLWRWSSKLLSALDVFLFFASLNVCLPKKGHTKGLLVLDIKNPINEVGQRVTELLLRIANAKLPLYS